MTSILATELALANYFFASSQESDKTRYLRGLKKEKQNADKVSKEGYQDELPKIASDGTNALKKQYYKSAGDHCDR